MTKKIIGFAGEIASGKSYSARYLVKKHGAESSRFSTALRDILQRLYLPESREVITKLSVALRQAFGEGALAQVIVRDAEKSTAGIVVVDGVRRPEDVKELFALPDFKLVYIETDPQIRFERLVGRGENADDTSKTWEEFMGDHKLPTEQGIPGLKKLAHVVINNNGSVEELEHSLDRLITE